MSTIDEVSLLSPSTLTALRVELRAAGWPANAITGLLADLAAQDPAPSGSFAAAFGSEAPQTPRVLMPPRGGVDVVIPCLNGRRSLLQTVQRVRWALPNASIIIADAGSTDGARELIRAIAGAGIPWLDVVLPAAPGFQRALLAGLQRGSGEIVLRQDLTPECDPAALPAGLSRLLEYEADLLFGSRWGTPIVPRSGQAWRRGMSAALFRHASGLWLSDPTAGVVAIRRDALQRMALPADPVSLDLAIAWQAARQRMRVCELPAFGGTGAEGDSVIRFTAALLQCALGPLRRRSDHSLAKHR